MAADEPLRTLDLAEVQRHQDADEDQGGEHVLDQPQPTGPADEGEGEGVLEHLPEGLGDRRQQDEEAPEDEGMHDAWPGALQELPLAEDDGGLSLDPLRQVVEAVDGLSEPDEPGELVGALSEQRHGGPDGEGQEDRSDDVRARQRDQGDEEEGHRRGSLPDDPARSRSRSRTSAGRRGRRSTGDRNPAPSLNPALEETADRHALHRPAPASRASAGCRRPTAPPDRCRWRRWTRPSERAPRGSVRAPLRCRPGRSPPSTAPSGSPARPRLAMTRTGRPRPEPRSTGWWPVRSAAGCSRGLAR